MNTICGEIKTFRFVFFRTDRSYNVDFRPLKKSAGEKRRDIFVG